MAMLLGAARILKDMEESLKGTVKLLFQPGEETGARMMVENGLLENPKVNAAKAWNGDYERITDEAGISVVDPDTFQYVENENPISFMNYFEAVYNGFVNGATIMGTLFISSGVIYLLECSGAFGAGISMILKKTRGKEFSVVYIFYTIFVIFGVLGHGEAAYPFYPLAVIIMPILQPLGKVLLENLFVLYRKRIPSDYDCPCDRTWSVLKKKIPYPCRPEGPGMRN